MSAEGQVKQLIQQLEAIAKIQQATCDQLVTLKHDALLLSQSNQLGQRTRNTLTNIVYVLDEAIDAMPMLETLQ